jgi:uncharacterized membrane protein YeaQ/YmgE (transglycosylase-associated protein family)
MPPLLRFMDRRKPSYSRNLKNLARSLPNDSLDQFGKTASRRGTQGYRHARRDIMFDILGWLVAGLVVGAIARILMPGRQGMGILATMSLGIVGALVGGAISYFVWGADTEPLSMYAWPGYVFAVLGSILVVAIAGANSYREYT